MISPVIVIAIVACTGAGSTVRRSEADTAKPTDSVPQQDSGLDTGATDSPGSDTDTKSTDSAETDADSDDTADECTTADSGGPCDRSLPWIYVAAGVDLTCGIHSDGCAECWGIGEEQGGPSWDTGAYHWTGEDIPPAEAFSSIALSGGYDSNTRMLHTCGISTAGEAICWGGDYYGESDAIDGSYLALSVGERGTTALSTDGSISTWGVAAEGPSGEYTAVSAGCYYGAAVNADGDLVLYGESDTVISGPYITVSIKKGICALRADGGAECWEGGSEPGSWPTFDAAAPKAGLVDLCVAYYDTACGLQADGHPVCWGNDHWSVVTAVPTEAVFTQIACGYRHACGLTPEGEIQCWGDDCCGETCPPG